jgi:uncharacterized lipoprotein YddW (UPF0748 family)
MKKTYLLIALSFVCHFSLIAQCYINSEFNKNNPKRELRGVFVASVYNLNWPSNKKSTPDEQKAELITLLDNLKTNGYNSVFFQVRSECDALYNSNLEPWSQWLTGTQGVAPSPIWDPLTFAVEEAHKRGLDLHAWLNPYRAQTSDVVSYPKASNHVMNVNPSWIIDPVYSPVDRELHLRILDPGLPAVTNFITTVVQDIASRYDVDGIHFDDYFYPNGGMLAAPNNQDAATFLTNNPDGLSLADWRRSNVNKMIAKVYDAIQTINNIQNKNIVFGVSPFGIWKAGTPTGISGNSSFDALYCDPIAWLNAEKVDYLAPQLYWKIIGSQDYNALSKWWNDQVKNKNKQLYISQAYYKMYDSNAWSATEIQNQINQNRVQTMEATFGQIAYNYTNIKSDPKSLNAALNATQYKYKSFAPPSVGKDGICPNPPLNLRFESTKLKWDTPAVASDGDLPIKYVVYAFNSSAEAITNTDDGAKILDIIVGNEIQLTQNLIDTKHFVVTALDKNNNEAGNFNTTLASPSQNFVSELKIYPNPFQNTLTIENSTTASAIAKVIFYTILGQEIIIKTVNESVSPIEIDTKYFSNGMHFIKIIFENGKSESHILLKN